MKNHLLTEKELNVLQQERRINQMLSGSRGAAPNKPSRSIKKLYRYLDDVNRETKLQNSMYATIQRKSESLLDKDEAILNQYSEAKNEIKVHAFERKEIESQIAHASAQGQFELCIQLRTQLNAII